MKFIAKSRPGIAGAALLGVIAMLGVCAGSARRPNGLPRRQGQILPQSHGHARHLAGAQEGFHEHGLPPGLRGRGRRRPGHSEVSLDKVQRLGVRSEEVAERPLSRTVRAFATLQFDERRQFVVAPKFSGWIEKLYVNATGDAVTVGQKLFDVYSPELNVLQQQWRLAGRSADAPTSCGISPIPKQPSKSCAKGTRHRAPSPSLRRSPERCRQDRHRRHALPAGRDAVPYRRHLGDVGDGRGLRAGPRLREGRGHRAVTVNAWPAQPFDGKVAFIYPTIGKESRTARLRIEVANPDGRLRADMAATVEIMTPLDGSRLAVPDSAVIDSGRRQVVLVERGEGRYEPRPVKLGAHVPGWVQVLDGVKPGERVVTQATFLIDAESNIRAALAAFDRRGDSTK